MAARPDLHSYFEPADDERDRGVKLPTAAHRAIAELVSAGRIRLILTTNFDHLIEDALTAAGVPQVISRSDAIGGMAPLQHARATVIKLHGDCLLGSIWRLSKEWQVLGFAERLNLQQAKAGHSIENPVVTD